MRPTGIGSKDKGKDDGGGGDLIVWLTLLEVAAEQNRDAVFVTEETKEDWFHRAGGGEIVFPRHELALEFQERVPGKAFGHMNLSELLRVFGAKGDVVEEVREQERQSPVARKGTLAFLIEGEIFEALNRALIELEVTAILLPSESRRDTGIDGMILGPGEQTTGIVVKYTSRFISRAYIAQSAQRISQQGVALGSEVAFVVVLDENDAVTNAAAASRIRSGLSGLTEFKAVVLVRKLAGHFVALVNQSTNPVVQHAFRISAQ